jgi:CubicO group peptidase (beta-lactamase class C family)
MLAAAALVLVDRGQLNLDAPVASAPYTLRHLLQHTPGLPDYGSDPEYHKAVQSGEAAWSADDFGYGLDVMIEPVRPGERLVGHAGSGPGSTITVFSALNARRTFAAAVGRTNLTRS